MTEETRTYEITFADRGPIRITIPATWKVTYGAVVPGKAGSAASGIYGLRVWETAEKQRAVWANVASFRDLSIQTEVAAVRKYGTQDWYLDDGTWHGERLELVEKAWKHESEVKSGVADWQRAMDEPDMADAKEEVASFLGRRRVKAW